jgi:membrane protein implicated in regulation of membrane protease activity
MCHLVLIGLPLAGLSVFWFLPLPIALPVYLLIAAATAAFYWYLYKGNSSPVLTGAEEMQRAVGKVLGANESLADVWVRSELWSAEYEGELREGDRVRVVGMDGLRLKVRKVADEAASNPRVG